MRKRTRTFLFILFVTLFLISVLLVVFYAQGYRWDFENQKLVKTGALSIGAQPHPTEIFVQGTREASTSILFPNLFMGHLIPQDYSLEVRREGYYTWSKILAVKQGEVAEALHVRLYPEMPVQEQVAPGVEAFFSDEGGRAALLVARDEEVRGENPARAEALSLVLLDPITNDRINLGAIQSPDEIKRIVWADDAENFFLIRSGGGKIRLDVGTTQGPYTISPITSLSPALRERAVLPTAQFMFTQNASFLYAALPASKSVPASQELFRIDLASGTLEGPFIRNVAAVLLRDDSFYTLEGNPSMLVQYNEDFTGRQVLTSEGFTKEECKLSYEVGRIFALCRGDLMLFEKEKGAFRILASEVQFFHPAPDGIKLAIAKTNEVLLYWLEESIRFPRHTQGDVELVLRLSRTVENILWLQGPYVYIGVGTSDMFRVVELDFRDGLNIVPYKNIGTPLAWLAGQQAILALREGNLIKIFLK